MDLKRIYTKRNDWSHKGDYGKVLIVGGSKEYTGAPALAALASYSSGADMVSVTAPKRAADITASFSPEIITHPLQGNYLNRKHFKNIEGLLEKHNALVFGNGLGENSEKLCSEVFRKVRKPCVVDGDALKFIDRKLGSNFVLTPHSSEFSILSGKQTPLDLKDRKESVKNQSKRLGCIIVLKGHVDIISDGKEIIENKTGSPYMTKAGTGDVLAGICGALLARGVQLLEAVHSAAYISGKAGELAAQDLGESLLATDIIERISEVIYRTHN